MSPFSRIVDATANMALLPSSLVPTLAAGPRPRFSGEPVRWISVENGAAVYAFARSAVRVFNGASAGIPGDPASAWTLIELSPLPGFIPQMLLALKGGLPVMYTLLSSQASTTIVGDRQVAQGEVVAHAAAIAGPSVWFGVCMQDRIVRDPALWSNEISIALTAAADAGTWEAFATELQTIESPARQIHILDHVGRPLTSSQSFTITTTSGSIAVTATDGSTGVPLPAAGQVQISFNSAAHPLIAGVQSAGGAFEGPYQLPMNERYVQVGDADLWFAERDNIGVTQLARWNPNSFLEGIADGSPYFARLVGDLRSTKQGGGVGLAGWAFVKESLLDKTLPWPLIPGQDDTQFVALVKELMGSNSQVRLLVNQFLQVENSTFDDGTAVLAVLWGLFAANFPVAAFGLLTTNPAGFGVLMGCIAAAEFLINTSWTVDALRAVAEASTGTVNDLAAISSDIAHWSPYPATTSDNPLFSPPLKVVGITLDDVIHFGVYHQKFVVGKSGAGDYFGYLGGIDINSDRVDSPLHRALFPYHDVQARLTGPALKDLIQTFAERSAYDHATLPFDMPATPPQLPAGQGRHLVQIGRTYYKPRTTPGFPFAPAGETVIHSSNLKAIAAARDFIYIEDQYFTPDTEYEKALLAAADHAQALIITVCMQNGQIYGPIRRAQVLDKLKIKWGDRMKYGALVRRYLSPTPATKVNLGRCVLISDIHASDRTITIGPRAHVPDPPFWVFVANELMQVVSAQADTDPKQITLNVNRGPIGPITTWGSKVDARQKGSPVMCVNVPHIYVHAKLMIVDDVFLSVGSANMNRRGHFHDGEINALAMPQYLKRDPANPAHVLRCQLWGEHLGLTPEMGLSLFADPLSALPYFDRPWLAGNRWQPLTWSGAATDDELGFSSSDTIGMELMKLAVGTLVNVDKSTFWPVLVDPTTFSDPNPTSPGPEDP
jgi:phosphatidylserine/phosphatidylglycerophosphate/cardiolipin synthase-like enzyme